MQTSNTVPPSFTNNTLEENEHSQKCAVKACGANACKNLNSKYCWPHTPINNPELVLESLMLEQQHSKLEE